jgi:hypothetical protein
METLDHDSFSEGDRVVRTPLAALISITVAAMPRSRALSHRTIRRASDDQKTLYERIAHSPSITLDDWNGIKEVIKSIKGNSPAFTNARWGVRNMPDGNIV